MGLLDKFLGRPEKRPPPPPHAQPQYASKRPLNEDQAIERYRYLLRTAPPEAIERVHQEAFARLTPQQRAEVLRELSAHMPTYEQTTLSQQDADPRALARLATRAEMREPGLMERMLGRWGGGGSSFGASLLTSFAAGFAGSLLANQLFESFHDASAAAPLAADPGTDDVAEVDYDPDTDADTDADLGGDFDADTDFGGGFDTDIDV
jgi:hypothetical protein